MKGRDTCKSVCVYGEDGPPKPLARSSAMFDTESTKDEEPCVYIKNKGMMPKKNRGTTEKKKNPKYQSAI